MKKTELQHFNQLDGFRFFAIAAVMIAHFLPYGIASRFPFGFGVLFFFVLSSFLITRILLNTRNNEIDSFTSNIDNLKQFYIRRTLRIFPIYYITIIVLYLINFHPVREIIFSLVTYTTNLQLAYNNNVDTQSFTHLWSLAIEEQFYLIFPFFIYGLKKKHLFNFLVLVVIIGLFGRMYLFFEDPNNISKWNFHSISALDSLGLGAILGYMSLYKIDNLKNYIANKFLFFSIAISFLICMYFSYTQYNDASKYNFYSGILMRFLFNILSFWVLGWSIVFGYNGIFKTILENKLLVYLGKISYGLYLYHFFILYMGNMILDGYNLIFSMEIKAIIFTLTSVLVASLSWKFVEYPINTLKNKYKYV
jgi:peptidoglycan/LPS O-acetylase OafA/YrhL